MPVTAALLRRSRSIGESAGCAKSPAKIKAPFVLTNMNDPCKPLLIWVWSRRGTRWVVDHEIRLDAAPKPSLAAIYARVSTTKGQP
jgi:hypothetical protein